MPNVVELAELADAAYDRLVLVTVRARSGPARLWTAHRIWDPALSGFTAVLYRSRHDPDQILAFAGTDSLWDVLVDDVPIAVGGMPPQALAAIAVAVNVASNHRQTYFTGHSLGGALAILAAAKTGQPAVTFNAPGVMDSCVATALHPLTGWSNMLQMMRRCVSSDRVPNLRIHGDPISSLLATGLQTGTTRPGYAAPQCGLNLLCRHKMQTVLESVRGDPANFESLANELRQLQ